MDQIEGVMAISMKMATVMMVHQEEVAVAVEIVEDLIVVVVMEVSVEIDMAIIIGIEVVEVAAAVAVVNEIMIEEIMTKNFP